MRELLLVILVLIVLGFAKVTLNDGRVCDCENLHCQCRQPLFEE